MATKAKKKKLDVKVESSLTPNVIALQKSKVIIGDDVSVDNRIPVATVQAHLMQYRYMLTQEAFDQLSKCDLSVIEQFHNEAIEWLKTMMGGKTTPKPLYKNFPEEVMSKSDCELYYNALLYYWTESAWRPHSVEMEKPVEFEKVKYTMLKPIDKAGFDKIFTDLVSINTSLTPQDLLVVEWFAANRENLAEIMPQAIPFKENLMTLASMGIEVPIKTPTDVLRIAVHMSGGDISLPAVPPKKVKQRYYGTVDNPERAKFRFRNFSRKERRYLLGLLEKTHCNPAEMVLKDQRWVRLGEILHPGDFKDQFPRSFAAFDKIRNTKVRSWYSKLTKVLYTDLNLEEGLKILSERPGEFVRRLDWLFRTFDDKKSLDILYPYLEQVMEKASNKVLFEVYTHFEKRNEPVTGRSVFIKGARKKTPLPNLPALKPGIVENIHSSLFVALRTKFSKLESLGNVWIDEELKKIPVPTNMRSLNLSLKPVVRGTRTPFDNPDAKVIRPFVHWKGPVDLDLSCTFVGTKAATTLSFSNLKVGKSCHSGDVRHQHGPCAEYIDIQIEDAIANGYQYAVVDLRNFDGGSLKKHDAVFGMMEREHPTSNKTWLPETITGAQQLEASGGASLIGILDLATKEYIHLDLDSSGITARGDIKSILAMINEYAKPPKFSVYDLLLMHAEARGKLVTLDDKVDTMFRFEDFANSYELTGKYML